MTTTCNECCTFNQKGKEPIFNQCPKHFKDLLNFVKKNNIKECPYVKEIEENKQYPFIDLPSMECDNNGNYIYIKENKQ